MINRLKTRSGVIESYNVLFISKFFAYMYVCMHVLHYLFILTTYIFKKLNMH